MLKEINSVDELSWLKSGTHILNRYRLPEIVRTRYDRPDDDWKETTFRLSIRKGLPYLIGQYGTTHKVKESDFSDDDRYFVEVP